MGGLHGSSLGPEERQVGGKVDEWSCTGEEKEREIQAEKR